MSVLEYTHTRELLVDHLRLPSETYYAALMQSNYVFNAGHTSFASMSAIAVSSLSAVLYSSMTDRYRVYIQDLVFPDITANVGGVVIYRSGFANNIDSPVLFYVVLPEAALSGTDYQLLWSVDNTPLVEW